MRTWLLIAAVSAWAAARAGSAVDPETLNGKLMCGYQGWFTAAGDDNPFDLWIHWGRNHAVPNGSNLLVDLYPDLSEYDADELFPTAMTRAGAPAMLYSGRTAKTVSRHVRWMQEYGIDGVFAQRFVLTQYEDPGYAAHINAVLHNLLTSAEQYGRVVAIMYDVSGASEARFWDTMRADWTNLVDTVVGSHPRYLHHAGRPVVGIWGMGFKDGVHPPADPATALSIVRWFQTNAPARYQATVVGGVPSGWRNLSGDSRTDAGWTNVYRAFDIISPWTVGRFTDAAGADAWRVNQIVPDLTEATRAGRDYLPVVWPGFSWHNLTSVNPLNQIPRRGGTFFWRQALNAITSGVSMVYVSMFDEVDEGTAIYKVAPTRAAAPDQGSWLTLDTDGFTLPSDWYLRLTYEVGRMLRGTTPPTTNMPVAPGPTHTERGTPLAWLAGYGLITNTGFDSADLSDTDADGMRAWQEYIAGTIPTNAESSLHIARLTWETEGSAMTLAWPGTSGRVYTVQTATNVEAIFTHTAPLTTLVGITAEMAYTNRLPAAPSLFYSLGVHL